MLNMKLCRNLIVMTSVLMLLVPALKADGGVELKAVCVHGSNDPAPMDDRLDGIEFQLRKLLPFEHFKFIAEGSSIIRLPGETTIGLQEGFFLEIRAWRAEEDRLRAEVSWMEGSRTLLKTAVNLKPGGKPAVLGGIAQGSGKLIVVLTAGRPGR